MHQRNTKRSQKKLPSQVVASKAMENKNIITDNHKIKEFVSTTFKEYNIQAVRVH